MVFKFTKNGDRAAAAYSDNRGAMFFCRVGVLSNFYFKGRVNSRRTLRDTVKQLDKLNK